MGFLSSIFPIPDPIDIITHPKESLEDGWHAATHPLSTVKKAGEEIGHAVTHPIDTVEKGVKEATAAPFRRWEALSREAAIAGHSLEAAGVPIGKPLLAGAQAANKLAQEGEEQTGRGLVAAGRYLTKHACDIALGTALGAVFSALAADGEEEVTLGALALACAAGKELGQEAAISAAADTAAAILAAPIYAIPGVADAVGYEEQFEEVLSWVISTTATLNPKLVVGTAGQYVAGAVISTVTTMVCEGKVPVGGPKLWHGVQG